MESLRALGLVGQDVQEEQENVVNFEMYLPPDGEQLACRPMQCMPQSSAAIQSVGELWCCTLRAIVLL